jgi:glycosyltransferase domain-containing protein
MLHKLTLFVLSYQRQNFAQRLMRYWSGQKPQVILIDGSKNPIEASQIRDLGDNIKYIHNPVGIYQRLRSGLSMISTEYVALAGDDEFYIPSALSACIKMLDEDKELVACCGRCLGFYPEKNQVLGTQVYPRLSGYSVVDDDPLIRVQRHMESYEVSQIYAVCRTKSWTQAFDQITLREFPVFAAGEIQFEMCMSFAGKSMVIPNLMWLRSIGENTPIRYTDTDASLNPSKRFTQWWRDNSNKKQHDEFIDIMIGAFSLLNEKSEYNYSAAVIAGCEAFISFAETYNGLLPLPLRNLYFFLRRRLALVLPIGLKSRIKQLFRPAIEELSEPKTMLAAAEDLRASGVEIDFPALKEIEQVILDFHR